MKVKGLTIDYFGSIPNKLNDIISKENIKIEYFYSNNLNSLGLVWLHKGKKIAMEVHITEDLIEKGADFMVDNLSKFYIKGILSYQN